MDTSHTNKARAPDHRGTARNRRPTQVRLNKAVGYFITMNPGYAGRQALPENLKALFRGCAMVVPDFENIIEIELSAEGFLQAKTLAHKFITLFLLSKELLSKAMHYDWGLRAIKGVLRIAGGMKRGEPDKQEVQILMRALRDTNLPKFVQADFGIFLGLVNDLFPRVDCPKQTDAELAEGWCPPREFSVDPLGGRRRREAEAEAEEEEASEDGSTADGEL